MFVLLLLLNIMKVLIVPEVYQRHIWLYWMHVEQLKMSILFFIHVMKTFLVGMNGIIRHVMVWHSIRPLYLLISVSHMVASILKRFYAMHQCHQQLLIVIQRWMVQTIQLWMILKPQIWVILIQILHLHLLYQRLLLLFCLLLVVYTLYKYFVVEFSSLFSL